jgi:hypothetical protein
VLEPLPPDCGEWHEDSVSELGQQAKRAGEKREERFFFDEGKQRLLKQGRYRSLESNAILRADPDQIVKRRRLRR